MQTLSAIQGLWDELNTAGFVRASSRVSAILYKNPVIRARLFDCNTGVRKSGDIKYSTRDLFGTERVEYFKVLDTPNAKIKFVAHLVKQFKTVNPTPSSRLRKALTHFLHQRGLCWEECRLHNPEILNFERNKNAKARRDKKKVSGEFIIQRFYADSKSPWQDFYRFGTFNTLDAAREALLKDTEDDPNGIEWARGTNPDQDGWKWRIVERIEKVYNPFLTN